MSRWLRFDDAGASPSGKTRRWTVARKDGSATLGTISWWGAWRAYVFAPTAYTVYEHVCLRDIAAFCEERTKEQRASWGRQKVAAS